MTSEDRIPFNRPFLTGQEQHLIGQSLASGALTGDGPFTARACAMLSDLAGGGDCLLTTSCTHALEMAAMLLRLGPGDEVLMPSFTFVSTANAVVLRGAQPVFVDCRTDTFNIDERLLEAAITPRTRAIMVVHYGGVACAMDEILDIAERHGLAVVEDNAHGLGGSYRGSPLGSFGVLAAQSFHATKNIQCGEGGALVVNERHLLDRAEIIREKGTNRSQFFRGAVDKYRWVDQGSSYLPSDLLAALLCAQLEQFEGIQARRRRVWRRYDDELAAWRKEHGVVAQFVPDECVHPAHLYALLMPEPDDQAGLLRHLDRAGILGTFHYVPLDSAPYGRAHCRTAPGGCPVTEDISSRLVRLPLFAGLTGGEVDRVVEAVTSYRPGARIA